MLLFHGTSGNRALIETIFAEGLKPHGGRHWAHELTGVDGHVLVSTSPVGSRGGDPIAYARARIYRDEEPWLVIVDLAQADHGLVTGAVPSSELERFWSVLNFFAVTTQADFEKTKRFVAAVHERGVNARELLSLSVKSVADGLCEEPDAATLVQFERAFRLANTTAQKLRVAASYDLTLPTDFVDDSHYMWCMGCWHHLFVVELVAKDLGLTFSRGSFERLDVETAGAMFDALARWFGAADPRALAKLHGQVSLAKLQRAIPPSHEHVPRTLMPDFATADLEAKIREARYPAHALAGTAGVDRGRDPSRHARSVLEPRPAVGWPDPRAQPLASRREGASATC